MPVRHSRFVAAALAAGMLVVAAPLVIAQSGGAGGFIVARPDGGAVTARSHITVPVQTVRTLIAAHHADVAAGTSDANTLTLMIDSNGDYVGSSATHAVAVIRPAGAPTAENSVSAAGGATSGTATGSTAGGFVVAAPTATATMSAGGAGVVAGSAEAGKMTFAGIGTVDASLVQDLFWTNYEAGEVSANALRIRFVILKNGTPR
jgi:hypothetical protein